jgi:hypothetical protein
VRKEVIAEEMSVFVLEGSLVTEDGFRTYARSFDPVQGPIGTDPAIGE